MIKTIKDPFIHNIPVLDVHGETTASVNFIVNDFINDNYKLQQPKVLIIHGKGSGKLKKAVAQTLKANQKILKYGLYNLNEGCTIAYLKIDSQ